MAKVNLFLVDHGRVRPERMVDGRRRHGLLAFAVATVELAAIYRLFHKASNGHLYLPELVTDSRRAIDPERLRFWREIYRAKIAAVRAGEDPELVRSAA